VRLKQGGLIIGVVKGHGVYVAQSSPLEMKPLPILVLASLGLIFTLACRFDLSVPEPATLTVRALTSEPNPAWTITQRLEVTAAPAALPSDFDATVQSVAQALAGRGANGLSALLANEVSLAQRPGALIIETLSHDVALGWLAQRWGSRHTVAEKQFIEHFVSIELVTDGWARIAPVQQGVIELHLHRYNAQGQGDALGGRWRVDTILYE
jgi:hypothetical protein